MQDRCNAREAVGGQLIMCGRLEEDCAVKGVFVMEHIRDGQVIARETFENTVATVGKNQMLDAALAGAAYTVTGPFMGLISSAGFSAIAAGDTMASHAGWTEAGLANAPTYTAPRKTCVWAAASGGLKALSAALSFTFTGTGTVKGAFLVYGTGAVATIDSTAGVLFSAGLFSGGDRAVVASDQINVSYSGSL